MDEVTLTMIRTLKERMEISAEIGRIKADSGLGVLDARREGLLKQKVRSLCAEIGLEEPVAERLLGALIAESVAVQSRAAAAGEGAPRGDDRAGTTHLDVFRRAGELEASGRDMIRMEVGEPDFPPPARVKDALAEACDMGMARYGPAEGSPPLREALAERASSRFGARVKPENVMVSAGARFSVYLAINSLLERGDEVLVVDPSWPAYKECATRAGARPVVLATSLEDGWAPDPAALSELVTPSTKMLVLNYPNNPTGKILSPKLQGEIVSVARDADLYVLSDEIYSEYAFAPWESVLKCRYEKSIAVQSFSKSHAMTGFRVGYAAAEPSIISRMARLQALCMTSVAGPMQHAAMRALDSDVSGNGALVKGRLEALSGLADGAGLEFTKPDGAMYLFARLPRGMDGGALANTLLEHGVAVAPGEGFGDYGDFIRVSACADEKRLKEGMDILGEVLRG